MTRIKICGVTNLEDAERAADLGAWAIGLIFHRPSPRACDPVVATQIGPAMRRRVEVVGVFVNEPLEELARTAELSNLSLLQLHGDEGPSYCAEAARRTGCRVIKAARVRDSASVQALRAFHVDYQLLDTHVTGLPGGTGETFAWDLARLRRKSVPMIVSGGLTADNVGEAITATRPFAVDVATGTEASPGRKDPGRLTAFFRAVEASAAPAVAAPADEVPTEEAPMEEAAMDEGSTGEVPTGEAPASGGEIASTRPRETAA